MVCARARRVDDRHDALAVPLRHAEVRAREAVPRLQRHLHGHVHPGVLLPRDHQEPAVEHPPGQHVVDPAPHRRLLPLRERDGARRGQDQGQEEVDNKNY